MAKAPAFEWTWNLNTLVVLGGFAAGFVAWGYTLAELKTGLAANAAGIDAVTLRVAALETEARLIANHELRLAAVERQAVDAASAMRAVESALNSLASDMRLTREILQRLETASRERRQP